MPASRRTLVSLFVTATALPLGAQLDPPAAPADEIARRLALGERVFLLHCAECHGSRGDGWGERRETTYARPRSFLSARFKFSTTENGVPSDDDLLRTLRRGLPGSGMPNWGWLPDEELEALVHYVRYLAETGLRESLDERVETGELGAGEAEAILEQRTVPGPPVVVPAETTVSDDGSRRGERIYLEACAPCHGADGNPAAGALKTDFEGNRLLPTSFAKGIFKGGAEGRLLYVRVAKGIPGTAMPAFEGAYSAEELWDVVHHVQSLATSGR